MGQPGTYPHPPRPGFPLHRPHVATVPRWPFILGGAVVVMVIAAVAAMAVFGVTRAKKRRSYKYNKHRYSKQARGFPGETAKDRKLNAKLAAYEGCIYRHSSRILQARSRYLAWIKNPSLGPTCQERYKYGPSKLSYFSSCRREIRRARDESPGLSELEKAGDHYLQALETLEPLLRKANRYYKREDFRDDDCQKGRKLHGKLMTAWDQLIEWDRAIRKLVLPKREALLKRRLALVSASKGLPYYYVKTLMDAQQMVETLRKQERGSELNMPLVRKAITSFEDHVDGLDEAYRTSPSARRPYMMSVFKLRAGYLLKAAKNYRRHKESGRDFRSWERRSLDRGSGWVVKGSFERVEYYYQQVLEYAPKVKFRE